MFHVILRPDHRAWSGCDNKRDILPARQVQDVPPFQAAHPGERQPRCAPFQYTAKVPVLLNHIRARDESMDEARLNKIENINVALT
jgi:hypothetical protein